MTYFYKFLTQMSIDKELITEMPKDLIQLRDLVLLIIYNLIIKSYSDINPSFLLDNINYKFSNFALDIFFSYNIITMFKLFRNFL